MIFHHLILSSLFLILVHNVAAVLFKMTVKEFEEKLNELRFLPIQPLHLNSKDIFNNKMHYKKDDKLI